MRKHIRKFEAPLFPRTYSRYVYGNRWSVAERFAPSLGEIRRSPFNIKKTAPARERSKCAVIRATSKESFPHRDEALKVLRFSSHSS
ncbi:hypothetical protein [Bacillus sp. FJAT-26390]|uniref:hypothetical protein n=1 Tax=Bacillus sp. FJAT-26390 TaxID=1743142 RepID=UPI001146B43F|nr:hypothetical protein [Bacillus sp. FJAT-26390]